MGETTVLTPSVREPMTEASESSGRVERVFTVGIFIFVVGRALVIWNPLQDGNVNPWIFLALDLGTAYPYAVSFPRLYSAIRQRRLDHIAGWSAVLTGSLLLPYIYVVAVGENVATWVWIVLGLFLLAGVTSAILRVRKLIGAHVSDVQVEILSDDALILEARQLRGERYLQSGFVERLSSDGTIEDRWVPISTYFGAIAPDGRIVGVARLIPYTWLGLPTLESFELSDTGRKILRTIPSGRLVEVSALAVARGQGIFAGGRVADALYRAMYQHSVVTAGYTHWCAALDQRVKAHLMNSHHFLLFEDIGEPKEYLGSLTVPVTLDLLRQARHSALTAHQETGFFVEGLVIDLRGDDVRLEAETGEFLPVERPITTG